MMIIFSGAKKKTDDFFLLIFNPSILEGLILKVHATTNFFGLVAKVFFEKTFQTHLIKINIFYFQLKG